MSIKLLIIIFTCIYIMLYDVIFFLYQSICLKHFFRIIYYFYEIIEQFEIT